MSVTLAGRRIESVCGVWAAPGRSTLVKRGVPVRDHDPVEIGWRAARAPPAATYEPLLRDAIDAVCVSSTLILHMNDIVLRTSNLHKHTQALLRVP